MAVTIKDFIKISVVLVVMCSTALLMASSKQSREVLIIEVGKVDKIQVITSMGNPSYGADSKTITDKNEITSFINTFSSGTIGIKVPDHKVGIGSKSSYKFYNGEEIVSEYYFNANDTNIIFLEGMYSYIDYGDELSTPYELYQNSRNTEIVVDEDGEEMDLVRYNDETYVKSDISEGDIKWLEWFHSLHKDQQMTISYSPDLGEPFKHE